MLTAFHPKEWQVVLGSWTRSGDKLFQTQSLEGITRTFTSLNTGDFEVEMSFVMEEGGNGGGEAKFVFSQADRNENYRIDFMSGVNQCRIIAGTGVLLWRPLVLAKGKEYRVRILVRKNRISTWVDNLPVFSNIQWDSVSDGKVGLGTYNAKVVFSEPFVTIPQQFLIFPELPHLFPGFDVIHVESGPPEWGYDSVWCGVDGSQLSERNWVQVISGRNMYEAECLTCSKSLRYILGLPPPGFLREKAADASKLPAALRAKFAEAGRPGWRNKCPACGKVNAMETLGPYELSRGPLQGESGAVTFRMGQMDVYQGFRYKERQEVSMGQNWICKYCGKALFYQTTEEREKSGFTQWNPQDYLPDEKL